MPKYIERARSDATAETLWPLVSDLTRHGEWSADPLEVTATGEGTYASVARSKGKEFRAAIQVLESVEPSRFAFRATDATGTYVHRFTLSPDGAGTTVVREIEATKLSLVQTVLFYAVLPVVKKPNARKALERLASLPR
jgi:hypothetical protein